MKSEAIAKTSVVSIVDVALINRLKAGKLVSLETLHPDGGDLHRRWPEDSFT